MKFTVEIKHRWYANILFSAEIEAPESTSEAVKTGLAVKEAVKRGADLSGASLSGADLGDAKDIPEITYRSIKADFWMILTQNPGEVPALISALREGRVNGSTYSGPCACLIGTIANAKHVDASALECDAYRPAESWFMSIREGDEPGDETEGGFRSQKALEWALEWSAVSGAAIAEADPVSA